MSKAVVQLKADQVAPAGNDMIALEEPYTVVVTISGVSPLLFHRWNVEAVETKARAAKGSAAKKSDDVESYLYRDDDGFICLPGEYLRQSIIAASKFKQDPRSPRKSAMDLMKAAIVALTDLASLGVKEPDYFDRRRVMVQRSGITRVRPAMKEGWSASVELMVNLPEYVSESFLRMVIEDAGRLCGVGDFRPTYGRFTTTGWRLGS
jgi:hypothetical protein